MKTSFEEGFWHRTNRSYLHVGDDTESSTVSKPSQPNVKGKLTSLVHLPLILRLIKDRYTQTQIAARMGVTKQAISKLMRQLIEHEYIRLDVRSSCNIYEILPRRQLILSGGSQVV